MIDTNRYLNLRTGKNAEAQRAQRTAEPKRSLCASPRSPRLCVDPVAQEFEDTNCLASLDARHAERVGFWGPLFISIWRSALKFIRSLLCLPVILLAATVGKLADLCGCEAVGFWCDGILFECWQRVCRDDLTQDYF